MSLPRRCLAEAIGTFGIVFAPAALSASGKLTGGDPSLAAAAWASGLSVLAMIYTFGATSGAHFNPAVTFALAVDRRFPWREVGPYALAQAVGSWLAAWIATALLGGGGNGVHLPHIAPMAAVGLEAALTFLLLTVIYGAAVDSRAPSGFAGVAIGLCVVFLVWIGGPATGGSMNPARSLGPALVAGGAALTSWWIYLVGPVLGAGIAVLTQRLWRAPNFTEA